MYSTPFQKAAENAVRAAALKERPSYEELEAQVERLEAALRGAGVAAELVEHIKVGD